MDTDRNVAKEGMENAPDFALPDVEGKQVRLSDYRGKANVVLVFNRGFA